MTSPRPLAQLRSKKEAHRERSPLLDAFSKRLGTVRASMAVEVVALHPYYSLLPSYVTRDSVERERDEFVERTRETLTALQQLRDGVEDVRLQKRHFRTVETMYKLKHALPKELHVQLIEVLVWHLWEQDARCIVDVDMEVRAVQALRLLLRKWCSKRPPVERKEIALDWRLAKRAIDRVCFSAPGQARVASPVTLQLLASTMIKCVENARPLFSAHRAGTCVVDELWEAFSPAIGETKSNECFRALGSFTLLLNICKPEESEQEWSVIEALIPLWLKAWSTISRCIDWDGHWFKVFSRVAKHYPEQSQHALRDALPFLFGKLHDMLELPSDLGSPFKNKAWPSAFNILHGSKRFDQHATRLCTYLLGNQDESGAAALGNQFVTEILTTVKPFFHPSNASRVANSVGITVYYLTSMISKRLGAEKGSKVLLKVESCRDIFDALLQIAFYGIYSKDRSVASKCMYIIKSLICIDPTHCARPVLDEMVKALDPRALSQSHMAPAAISSLSVFLYHLMCGQGPDGVGLVFSTYLAPLLRLTLPGIDANDEKKTMATVTLYFHVLSWLPLVNDVSKKGGDAVVERTAASTLIFGEMEGSLFAPMIAHSKQLDRKIWELGSFLEEWSLALLDRCLDFVRTRTNASVHDAASKSSTDSSHGTHKSRGDDRVVLEVLNMTSLLYAQMSPAIYTQALRKTVNFVSNAFFTSSFGGKVISNLVFDCLQGDVRVAAPEFMRLVHDKLQQSKRASLMNNEKVWFLSILNGIVRFNDARSSTLLAFQDDIRDILCHFLLKEDDKEVYEAAGGVLEQLLHALVGVYPVDFRSLPPEEWSIATSESTGMSQFLGAAISWKRLNVQWHEPNEAELVFAHQLLEDHLLSAFKTLEELRSSKDITVRQWVPHLKRVFVCVRGARNIFVDETSGDGALQAGSRPLLITALAGNGDLLKAFVSLKSIVLNEAHAISLFWRANGQKGVTENQIWHVTLKLIKQLLVWRGSHLDGHRSKEKQNMYIKATTADVASRQFRKLRRFEMTQHDEVPLSSRNEMVERVLFFYSKRKVQEHFETAHHVLSGRSGPSPLRTQYENLLLDVEALMKHPYEEVRNSANGVIQESTEIFAKWMYSRLSEHVDVLEGKVIENDGHVKEEAMSGALEFLRRPLVLTHTWKTRGKLLQRILLAVLNSNDTVLQRLETEASKVKIGLKIQGYFLALLAAWRYVREGRSDHLITELLGAEPPSSEHWKQQLMHMVCFFPLLQPHETPLPIELWRLILKQLRHDVLPVRQVALLLLSQLVKLHKAEPKATGNEIDAFLGSEDTLKLIIKTFVDNHRSTHKFSASADGQHANSAPSDWSFGVNEVIRYLSNTTNAYPKPAPMSSVRLLNHSSDALKNLEFTHIKLVQRLTQIVPHAVVRENTISVLDGLTAEIGTKVSDEDRQATISTLGEWIAGMVRGLVKLPNEKEDAHKKGVKSAQSLIKKVLPHLSVTHVDTWSHVLYYVSRPRSLSPSQLEQLSPIVTYVVEELEQSFVRATAEDYANQVKWLSLAEPLLVHLLAVHEASSLRTKVRDTVVSVIEEHGLAHRYKMVRDRVAKTLFIIDASDASSPSESPVTERLMEKLASLSHVENTSAESSSADGDDDSDELSAKETAMQWLVSADRHGDTHDFTRVMKHLFPVAFLSQNHQKVEIALLAKNTTNAVSLSLRLQSPPADAVGFAHLDELLSMLEQFATHQLWKTRAAVLRFLTSFTFYHWIFLSAELQQRVQNLVTSFFADEQREVQDMAKYTLRGLVHIQRSDTVEILSKQLIDQAQESRVKHPKLVRRLQKQEQEEGTDADEVLKTKSRIKTNEKKMATSVLGMSAIVLAFPYSVPSFVPPLFEEMGRYLYLKHSTPTVSFLEKSVKDTLLEFKRTHQDNWLDIKNSFTQQQRDVFEDVLISPSYYT